MLEAQGGRKLLASIRDSTVIADMELLKRTYPDKYTTTYYIDPDSYLIYKSKQMSFDDMLMEVVEETIYSDYQNIEGIMTAKSLRIMRDSVGYAVLTIFEVKFNTGLEDSFFKINQ